MATANALRVVDDPSRAASLLHPLRARILDALDEPDSATGLAKRIGLPRQKVNYHLRQLEQEGFVEMVEERQKRGCTERIVRSVARSYLIDPGVLGSLATDPERIPDRASSAYQVAVAARVVRELAEVRRAADDGGAKLSTLTLTADVRFATPASQNAFAQDLSRAVAPLIARHHDEEAPDGRTFRFFAGAHPVPPGAAADRTGVGGGGAEAGSGRGGTASEAEAGADASVAAAGDTTEAGGRP